MIMESIKCTFVPPGGGDAMMQRTFRSADVDGLTHSTHTHTHPVTYHPPPQWVVSSNKLEQKGKCSEIRCFCSQRVICLSLSQSPHTRPRATSDVRIENLLFRKTVA